MPIMAYATLKDIMKDVDDMKRKLDSNSSHFHLPLSQIYEKTKKLVEKEGNNRKSVSLHNDMNVQTEGTVLLDYKFLGIETEGS